MTAVSFTLVAHALRLAKAQTHNTCRKFRSGGLGHRANAQPPDLLATDVRVLQLRLRDGRGLLLSLSHPHYA